MELNTSDVLDLSKENIQPLRQGRKAAQLKTALQAQTDPETHQKLLKQREKFEYAIRMYEGDDPLEPYYNYVIWLEQSFPTIGRENNLILLLEDTLLKFKDCDKYKQDPRLIQLLVKYINVQSNPLELYQLVYNQGLGTMCSIFYKAWAEELDKSNDFKRADHVYQLGLQCRAQPFNELQEAHVQFQLSIARRLLEGNINEPLQTNEPSRTVLSKLQPSKVRSSRIGKDSAGKLPASNGQSGPKSSNFGTAKFTVYQEDETDGYTKSEHRNEFEKLPKGSIAGRENVMKADKWYGQKHRQSSAYRKSVTPSIPFEIHEDPEAVCDTMKTVLRPCALKIRKEEFRCPVAIFGPPDPTQKPMYPKQLVYVGGRDMQLEEIRAAYYWKKVEEEERKNQSCEKAKETNICENSSEGLERVTFNRPESLKSNSTDSNSSSSDIPVPKPGSPSNLCTPSIGNQFDVFVDGKRTLGNLQRSHVENIHFSHRSVARDTRSVISEKVRSNENSSPKQDKKVTTLCTGNYGAFATSKSLTSGDIYVDENVDACRISTAHPRFDARKSSTSITKVLFSDENAIPERNFETENIVTPMDVVQCVQSTATTKQCGKTFSSFDVFMDEGDATSRKSDFIKPKNPLTSSSAVSVFRDENSIDKSSATSNTRQAFEFEFNEKHMAVKGMGVSDKMTKLSVVENSVKNDPPLIDPFADEDMKQRRSKVDMSSFGNSELGNMSMLHHSPSTSMTINTRAAMNVIQQMWESPLSQQSVQKIDNYTQVQSDQRPFSVYCEDSILKLGEKCTNAIGNSLGTPKMENKTTVKNDRCPFPIYCEDTISNVDEKQSEKLDDLLLDTHKTKTNAKSDHYPFPVYCEDPVPIVEKKQLQNIDDLLGPPTFAKPKLVSRTAFEDDFSNPVSSLLKMTDECGRQFGTPSSGPLIVPVNLKETPIEQHNKENRLPMSYLTPEERKPLCAPLREINDSDTYSDNHTMYVKNNLMDDETCNTNAFRIVLPSSTPCSRSESSKVSRKSILYNG